jgi:hypothetical protein
MKKGDIIQYNGREYSVIKFQAEGIRLKGTKNNLLGERFEIVINENDFGLDNPSLKAPHAKSKQVQPEPIQEGLF